MAKERGRGPLLLMVGLLLGGGGLTLWLIGSRLGGPGVEPVPPVAETGRPHATPVPGSWAPEQAPPPATAAAAIEGLVLDRSGAPVDGARVALTRALRRDDPLPLGAASSVLATATTSGQGRFRFADLSAGDYNVGALADGTAPGHTRVPGLGATEQRQVEIRLGEGGFTLSGRVADAGGGNVPGATLSLTAWDGSGPGLAARAVQGAASGEGTFALTVAAGSYAVVVQAPGYVGVHEEILVTGNLRRDFLLTPAARVLGRVLERGSRQPVPDAEVSLSPAERTVGGPGFHAATRTDASGSFALVDVEDGRFQLTARKGRLGGRAREVIALGAAQVLTDVEIEVGPAAAVTGQVRAAGDRTGLPGARVSLVASEGTLRPRHVVSVTGGAFTFEGVLPGTYRVEVAPAGYGRASRPLQVGGGDVTGVDLEVAPGAVVAGRVVDGSERPVAGVRVSASVEGPGAGPGGPNNMTFDRAVTGPDGNFELVRLGAGQLRLVAEQGEQDGVASLGPEPLAPGARKQVTLKLRRGAFIAGTVRSHDGAPAANVRVGVMVRDLRGSTPSHAATDPAGRYRLGPLPPGMVVVAADRRGQLSFRSGDRDPPHQRTVTLADGEDRTGVDLTVAGGGMTMSGTLVAADGKPVGLATVMAAPETGGPAVRSARAEKTFTDHDGRWTLDDLSSGPHTVWAVHPDHAEAEQTGVAGGSRNVRLQLPPGSVVSGVVTDGAGKPVSDYVVVAAPGPAPGETADQKRRRRMNVSGRPSARVHDAGGAFTLRRLRPGSYELIASAIDGRTGSQVVTLQSGEPRSGVHIALATGVRITGRVHELGSDAPLAGVEVRAFGPANARVATTTAADGSFVLDNVPFEGTSLRLSINGDPRTHVPDNKTVPVPAAATTVDVGAIGLLPGNARAQSEARDRGDIGVFIDADQTPPEVRVMLPGSAAARAKLHRGDRLLAVDGQAVTGFGAGAINFLINGKIGTTVTLTVQTPGAAPRTVRVVREAPRSLPS
jgi:hypothetical protein